MKGSKCDFQFFYVSVDVRIGICIYFILLEHETFIHRDKKTATSTVLIWTELVMADLAIVETQKRLLVNLKSVY